MAVVHKLKESCEFVVIFPVPVPRGTSPEAWHQVGKNLYSGNAEPRRVCCGGGSLSGALISLWSCLELMSCCAARGTGSKVSPTQVH